MTDTTRRTFILGVAGTLAVAAAPAMVTGVSEAVAAGPASRSILHVVGQRIYREIYDGLTKDRIGIEQDARSDLEFMHKEITCVQEADGSFTVSIPYVEKVEFDAYVEDFELIPGDIFYIREGDQEVEYMLTSIQELPA